MIIAMILIGVAVVAFCAWVGLTQVRRRGTPEALQGDWWAEFERDFRAHVARVEREAGHAGRRDRRPPRA